MDIKLPKQPTQEVGETGLVEYRGIVQQEFLTNLRISGNAGGYKVFDEMRRNSPVIGALLNAIKQAVLGVDWEWRSEDENDPRLELLQAAEENMRFTLKEHFTEALTMLAFGFSLFEIVYERVGGRMLWKKFAFRGQDTVYRWEIDDKKDKGHILGFWQQSVNTYVPQMIPMEKCLHYRTSTERNNPEGMSILRPAYIPYFYSKNMQAIEAIGIERDLVGLPIITLPSTASSDPASDDYKEALQLVRRVRNDEQGGIVLREGYDFRLASADSSRLNNPGDVISRHEKRMLMASLAQFLALGMDQVGTFALSADQTDFFNMSVNTFADMVQDTFNKQAVKKLLILNGMDTDGIYLEHSPAGDVNIDLYTKALQQATGLITWTSDDEVMLRSVLGLPAKTVEELDEAQEVERERSMAALANFGPPASQAETEEEQDEDEMSAEHFGAVEQKHERSWTRALTRFFRQQRREIIDEVTK